MTRIIAINTTMCSTVAACGDLGSGETTTSMAARSHGPGNTVRHTVLPPIPIDGQTRLVAVDRAGEQRSSTEAEG